MMWVLLDWVGGVVYYVGSRRTHTWDMHNPYMRDTYDGYRNEE